MVLVRETVLADWQALRDIRLEALRDAPTAFGSTYELEVLRGEAHWRDRVARGGTFLAFVPEVSATEPAGLIGGYQEDPVTVELVSYAHSIDFGAKGYGNLVELAALQRHVADALGVPVGRLLMIIKSAHVYETELDYIEGVLASQPG